MSLSRRKKPEKLVIAGIGDGSPRTERSRAGSDAAAPRGVLGGASATGGGGGGGTYGSTNSDGGVGAGDGKMHRLPSMSRLQRDLDEMQLDELQRARFQEFLFRKTKLLKDNELNAEDFENVCMLGFGNGGSVWKVRHRPTGIILARKMIHLEIKGPVQQQILRELKILHECNSPQVVGFYGSFCSDGEINIIMEYMDCGSLDTVLGRLGRVPEDVLCVVTARVLEGLTYLCDKQRILHRDVKPSNVLVNTDGEIKLCDFGVSGELNNSLGNANTFVGTRSYMSPERLLGKSYGLKSDMWSLGLSLVEMATGHFPIPPKDPPPPLVEIRDKPLVKAKQPPAKPSMAIFELLSYIVESEPVRLPQGQGFTSEFCDFVARCLQKVPDDRPSLAELQAHPWLQRAAEVEVDVATWARSSLTEKEMEERRLEKMSSKPEAVAATKARRAAEQAEATSAAATAGP